MSQHHQDAIDIEIRTVLRTADAPLTIEAIAREVDSRLGCGLTPVARRVRGLPDVRQDDRRWRLTKDHSTTGANTNHA